MIGIAIAPDVPPVHTGVIQTIGEILDRLVNRQSIYSTIVIVSEDPGRLGALLEKRFIFARIGNTTGGVLHRQFILCGRSTTCAADSRPSGGGCRDHDEQREKARWDEIKRAEEEENE